MRHDAWGLALALALGGCDGGATGAPPDPSTDGAAIDLDVVDAATPDADGLDAGVDDGVDRALDAQSDAEPPDLAELPVDAGPPPAPARHVALGAAAPGDQLEIEVPPGARSVLVQARGQPDGIYAVVGVEGPDGALSDGLGRGAWRSAASPEVAVALWPPTDDPAASLVPGTYRFSLVTLLPEAQPLEVEAYLGFGAERLEVNAFLPPALGFAVDHPSVVQFALALEQALGALLDRPVEVAPVLLADGAPVDLVVDSAAGDLAALSALAAAAPDVGSGLDVYLVGQVVDAGDRQSGFSGGLPAPLGLRGTRAAVTAIRTPLLEDFPIAVADLAAHELGHALGLFHTTEPFGDRVDPITDTPACPLECDRDGDGVLLASECGRNGSRAPPCQGAADNFMFWTLGGRRDHTRGQRRVARGHPVLSP